MKRNALKTILTSVCVLSLIMCVPFFISIVLKGYIPNYINQLEKKGIYFSYTEIQTPFKFFGLGFRFKEANVYILNQKLDLGTVTIDTLIFNPYRQEIITTGTGKNALSLKSTHDNGLIEVKESALNLNGLSGNLTGWIDIHKKDFKLTGRADGVLSFISRFVPDEIAFMLSFVLKERQQKVVLDVKKEKIRFNGFELMPLRNLIKE